MKLEKEQREKKKDRARSSARLLVLGTTTIPEVVFNSLDSKFIRGRMALEVESETKEKCTR